MLRDKVSAIIVTPIFNDWDAFSILAGRIKAVLSAAPDIDSYLIVAVNDGSTKSPDGEQLRDKNVDILHLNRNVGHQRAIAIGLAYIADTFSCEHVIVMDADGEDKPEDLITLLNAARSAPNTIIFGRRTKRTEGLLFRFFYRVYKIIFYTLTGKSVGFGNFSIIPASLLVSLVYISEIWNNYAIGVVKSRIPYTSVPIERGKRYVGESKMNFNSLILHGMSAIAILIDVISVRVILVTTFLLCLSIIGLIVVFAIRLFTPLSVSVPGWTSSIMIGLITFLVQSFLITLLLIFMTLNYRTQKLFIPALDFRSFMLRTERIR